MSFSKEVKTEIFTIKSQSRAEMLAELLAFLHLKTKIKEEKGQKFLIFETKFYKAAMKFLKVLKYLYSVETDMETEEETKLLMRKSIKIKVKSKAEFIIEDNDLLDKTSPKREEMTKLEDCKKAYLRASFMISGSVNAPTATGYHLEIYAQTKENVIFIQRLMNHFALNAKIIKRRTGYIVYLKEVEKISDFLRIIGAQKSGLHFEDLIIKRDFNNSINRLINCEIANQVKTDKNSNKILNAIYFLEKINASILKEDNIQKVIKIRKENPESSLNDLVLIYQKTFNKKISKSGLNHRYLKILKEATNLKN